MSLHKQIFLFCMLLIVVLSIYRIFLNMKSTSEAITSRSHTSSISTRQPEVVKPTEVSPTAMSEVTHKPSITYADAQENIVWHSGRGYFSFEEQETYKSYDLAALKNMAQNSDIRALNELANRSIAKGDYASAERYYWDAAAIGNSIVLLNLARLKQTVVNHMDAQGAERKAKERGTLLDGLAILELASIRGDTGAASLGRKVMGNSYQYFTGEVLELSAMENELIALRAEELYKDLLKKRHELGLGDFDNSSSKVVKEVYAKP